MFKPSDDLRLVDTRTYFSSDGSSILPTSTASRKARILLAGFSLRSARHKNKSRPLGRSFAYRQKLLFFYLRTIRRTLLATAGALLVAWLARAVFAAVAFIFSHKSYY